MLFPCRIVVCGAKLKRSIVPNSATVYNFQRAFQLEQEEVSRDHQPGLSVAAVHGAVGDSKAELLQVQQRQPGTTGLPVFGVRQPGPSSVGCCTSEPAQLQGEAASAAAPGGSGWEGMQGRHAALT